MKKVVDSTISPPNCKESFLCQPNEMSEIKFLLNLLNTITIHSPHFSLTFEYFINFIFCVKWRKKIIDDKGRKEKPKSLQFPIVLYMSFSLTSYSTQTCGTNLFMHKKLLFDPFLIYLKCRLALELPNLHF